MSELSLRRRGGLPTSAADELRGEHRRTRWLRLALAAAALGLLLGAFGLARDLHALPTSYFASGSGGIVVLDLSTSVDAQKSQRVMRVLQSLSETEGRIGLVVFSDSAYEMLPPDTRSEELRPLLRFFDQGPVGFGRPGGFGGRGGGAAPNPAQQREESPWSLAFRGGTRISTGLAEARQVIAREGDRSLSVLLNRDSESVPVDVQLAPPDREIPSCRATEARGHRTEATRHLRFSEIPAELQVPGLWRGWLRRAPRRHRRATRPI